MGHKLFSPFEFSGYLAQQKCVDNNLQIKEF